MFNKISDISAQLNKALSLNKTGKNDKCDSKAEYDALSKLLSGCSEKSEAYEYIEGFMVEYNSNGNVKGNLKQSADNTVTQQGVGNVYGDNNSVTVNYLTIDQSRERGSRLADILVGISDGDEYPEVRRIIRTDVNEDNVMEVLRGYEDKRPSASKFTNGDHFFEQLFTESSFDEKNTMLKTMARHLRTFFANNNDGGPNSFGVKASRIDVLLKKPELTKEDAKTLDKIYMDVLGD